MLGRVELRGADLIQGRRRDHKDFGRVGRDVRVRDDAVQVDLVFIQRQPLVIDRCMKRGVVGAE